MLIRAVRLLFPLASHQSPTEAVGFQNNLEGYPYTHTHAKGVTVLCGGLRLACVAGLVVAWGVSRCSVGLVRPNTVGLGLLAARAKAWVSLRHGAAVGMLDARQAETP